MNKYSYTLVVVLAEVALDIAPDVGEVDEVKEERQFLFAIADLILDCIGVGAVVGLLVTGLEIADEGVEESFFALCCQGFVIGL